ncbi:SAM-dependent DNA methyltransferase [Polynucleobacter sp. P1-05-14]|uniref:SAM-dependent DNA methyltransferase n=1 Tax=Polynucleobacter sp. P1-05-14 TaxID=1819732 RepID=UPI001C0D8E3A|nr:SAM-dependent DNA methyltransferase [Polynucleobacter sp. P1-05-14]MBU3548638.1 SAM-dependent DNA methyltransferase [Polynucleobacter sp. P1-05-14]
MSIETKEGASDSQVVSKQRVADHGEVFTAKREVDAMLDLVKHETDRIDSRFLEPACGTGNFLAEVLDRKLTVVTDRYGKSEADWDRYAIIAASSIYGIDILPDNVKKCRERLFKPFEKCREEVKRSVKYILDRNIVCGDALSLRGIIFSEWSPVGGGLKRRDFAFHELIAQSAIQELPLFSDLGDDVFIPDPVKDYPVTHIFKIADVRDN